MAFNVWSTEKLFNTLTLNDIAIIWLVRYDNHKAVRNKWNNWAILANIFYHYNSNVIPQNISNKITLIGIVEWFRKFYSHKMNIVAIKWLHPLTLQPIEQYVKKLSPDYTENCRNSKTWRSAIGFMSMDNW